MLIVFSKCRKILFKYFKHRKTYFCKTNQKLLKIFDKKFLKTTLLTFEGFKKIFSFYSANNIVGL